GGCRQFIASQRRAVPPRRRFRSRARTATRRAGGTDRSGGRPPLFLFLAAGQCAAVPERWTASGAGGERLAARLRLARRADYGGGGLSELGVQFLGGRVCAGEDCSRCSPEAARGDRQGADASVYEREAQKPRRRSDADDARTV